MAACGCANPSCAINGCILARQQYAPPWPRPNMTEVAVTPRGCVCPPGSEKTCEGIGCPRQNPLKQK